MNFLSKKSIFGLIVFLLLAGTLIYLSNNREIHATTSAAGVSNHPAPMLVSDVLDYNDANRPAPFDFKIVMSKCTKKTIRPLVTLQVVLLNVNEKEPDALPGLFSYQWVADGTILPERSPVLACFCARTVDVTVTRVKDGARVRKTVKLYACNSIVPQAYNEKE